MQLELQLNINMLLLKSKGTVSDIKNTGIDKKMNLVLIGIQTYEE